MINTTTRVLLALTVTITFAASAAGATCPGLTATAANTGPVCKNAPVTLIGSSNQSGVTYTWTGPHTWFSTQQNPTAPGPGMYFLEVKNTDGVSAAYADTTVQSVTPPPMTLSGSATQACGGETFTVSLDDSSSFTDFDWEASGATILSGQGTPTVLVRAENFNVLATVFVNGVHAATGCDTSPTLSYRVDVDPRYPAEITAPSSACPNSTLTASVPATWDAAYNWTITNGTITMETSHTIEFVPDGNGDVSVTATVYNLLATCASTDTAVISIDSPTAILTPPQDAVIQPGGKTILSVMASGPNLLYRWYEGPLGDRSHLQASGCHPNRDASPATHHHVLGRGHQRVRLRRSSGHGDGPERRATARGQTLTSPLNDSTSEARSQGSRIPPQGAAHASAARRAAGHLAELSQSHRAQSAAAARAPPGEARPDLPRRPGRIRGRLTRAYRRQPAGSVRRSAARGAFRHDQRRARTGREPGRGASDHRPLPRLPIVRPVDA